MDKTTSLAVVTGASSGIGLELAKQFAQNGFDLLNVAEDANVRKAAQMLRGFNVAVSDVQIDLARPVGVEELYQRIQLEGRPVDAIALNAGVGGGGDFVRGVSLELILHVIDLNVRSTVHLAKLVLPEMVSRRSGKVLFTSSIASTMPRSFNAV